MTAKGWVNISLIGVGVIVAVLVMLLINKCNQPKPDIVATSNDSTQYYKNKLGQEVAAIKQTEQEFYRVKEAGYLDSIAKLHNTKAKLLQEVTTLKQKGTVTIAVASPPIIKRDTIPGQCNDITSMEQVFTNPYYYAEVSLSTKDSSRILIETFDTLTIVSKTVKEGGIFSSRKYLQVDAVNSNPFNHITGLQVYKQPLPKQKKIGIGVFAGYGIGGSSFKPGVMIGVGVQYNFIRL